ncbi:MAG: (Fe-S)-binding protein [Proteobacteria bacterium]|nr:(Fe-S)-binding protein [Pseudomonadota bacterium]
MEDNLREKLLTAFEGKLTKTIEMYLETCARCGICTTSCHVFRSMPRPEYSPAARAEVVRKLYKKYFKLQGKLLPSWGEAKVLDDTALDDLNKAAYSCTGCRRCMIHCPFGIDTQQIMSIAKLMLVVAQAEPEILSMLADVSISKGESIDLIKQGFIDGLKRLEADVVGKWKLEAGQIPIPTEVQGADVLYVALAGAHSIIPAAAVFNAAKENWTLSFFEAVNFGAFVGDPAKTKLIMDRIINEANRLNVKEVCICECGTAFRVLKQMSGKQSFTVSSITQVHARYIREKRITLAKNTFKGIVTYHDPCQIARNGGVMDEPRYILKHLTDHFVDMSKKPEANFCCGGGGLVALGEDTHEFRMKSAKVKADQVKATHASLLVTACENCHSQLNDLNTYYKMGVEVKFLSSLVADALVRGIENKA